MQGYGDPGLLMHMACVRVCIRDPDLGVEMNKDHQDAAICPELYSLWHLVCKIKRSPFIYDIRNGNYSQAARSPGHGGS